MNVLHKDIQKKITKFRKTSPAWLDMPSNLIILFNLEHKLNIQGTVQSIRGKL